MDVLDKFMGKFIGPVIPYKPYCATVKKILSPGFYVGYTALYDEFIQMANKFPPQREDVVIERAKRIKSIIESSKTCLKYQDIADELNYENELKWKDDPQRGVENHLGEKVKITAESIRNCVRKTQMLGKRSRRAFIEELVSLFTKSRRHKSISVVLDQQAAEEELTTL